MRTETRGRPGADTSVAVWLTARERTALDRLCEAQELTPSGILIQGLRLYQEAQIRLKRGEHLGWYDADGNRIVEQPGGCMGDE